MSYRIEISHEKASNYRLFIQLINIIKLYKDKFNQVMDMLNVTAFFPGGKGLWFEENSEKIPDFLVLGQDFNILKNY